MKRRQEKVGLFFGAGRRGGLTLVELLVVLAILALMATVAITSTDLLMSQGRYEATVRTLTNVQEAVLGPSGVRQADGTLLISGFVADVGRLPIATSNDPRLALSELWDPDSLPQFAIRPASDPEVLVPCGWRGPYLRLPVGTADLRDGWGNPLVLLDESGNGATVGTPIHSVGSLGLDKAVGGTGYDADFGISLADSLQTVLAGHVYELDDDGNQTRPVLAHVTVKLYGYEPAAGVVSEVALTKDTTPPLVEQSHSLTFSVNTTAGPRFLRAYLDENGDGTWEKKSCIVRVQRSDEFDLMLR